MAKKTSNTSSRSNGKPAAVSSTTSVRNSALPRQTQQPQVKTPRIVTHADIARRAYEISQSPQAKSQMENWLRAERELKGGK